MNDKINIKSINSNLEQELIILIQRYLKNESTPIPTEDANFQAGHFNLPNDYILQICRRFCNYLENDLSPALEPMRKHLRSNNTLFHTLESSNAENYHHPFVYTKAFNGRPPCTSIHNKHKIPQQIRAIIGREITGTGRTEHILPTIAYQKHFSLYTCILGHLSSVYCVCFDRTGHYIITGADDHLVKIWGAWDGRLLVTLRGHSAQITDLAIDWENTLLVASSVNKIIRVWSMSKNFCPIAILTGHSAMITMLQFSPYCLTDKRYLVSSGNDGNVCIWTYSCKQQEFDPIPIKFIERTKPGNQMLCSSFSSGGVFLAAGGSDHFTRIYYFGNERPEKIDELETHTDRVDSIKFANHSLRFITGSKDGLACIWTLVNRKWIPLTLQMATKLPNAPKEDDSKYSKLKVSMVSWNCNDSLVLTAMSNFRIKIWNPYKGYLLHELKAHSDDIFVLEQHPKDPNLMISASHDGYIILWDISSGIAVNKIFNNIENYGHGAIFDCKFSPHGLLMAATDSHGQLSIFGFGYSDAYNNCPREQFFHTDFRPLVRDANNHVIDEQTHVEPHLMPPPFLVDIDGNPYPTHIQRRVPGRYNCVTEQLVPNVLPNERGEMEIMDMPYSENDQDDRNNNVIPGSNSVHVETPGIPDLVNNETVDVDINKNSTSDLKYIDDAIIRCQVEKKKSCSEWEIQEFTYDDNKRKIRAARLNFYYSSCLDKGSVVASTNYTVDSRTAKSFIANSDTIPNHVKYETKSQSKPIVKPGDILKGDLFISDSKSYFKSSLNINLPNHSSDNSRDKNIKKVIGSASIIKRNKNAAMINLSPSLSPTFGNHSRKEHLPPAFARDIDEEESDSTVYSDWEIEHGVSLPSSKSIPITIPSQISGRKRKKRNDLIVTSKINKRCFKIGKRKISTPRNLLNNHNIEKIATSTRNSSSPSQSNSTGSSSHSSLTTTRRNKRYDVVNKIYGRRKRLNHSRKNFTKGTRLLSKQSDISKAVSHIAKTAVYNISDDQNNNSRYKYNHVHSLNIDPPHRWCLRTKRNNSIEAMCKSYSDTVSKRFECSTNSNRLIQDPSPHSHAMRNNIGIQPKGYYFRSHRETKVSSIDNNENENLAEPPIKAISLIKKSSDISDLKIKVKNLASLSLNNQGNSSSYYQLRRRKLNISQNIRSNNNRSLRPSSRIQKFPNKSVITNIECRKISQDKSPFIKDSHIFNIKDPTNFSTTAHAYFTRGKIPSHLYSHPSTSYNSISYHTSHTTPSHHSETLPNPPDWMSQITPKRSPFVPQIGDEVVYLRRGHEAYANAVRDSSIYPLEIRNLPFFRQPSLPSVVFARVTGLRFEIKPPRLCRVQLTLVDKDTGSPTGGSFSFKYHDVPGVVDFLLLKQTYEDSLRETESFVKGTRIRSFIDDAWWLGTIESLDDMNIKYFNLNTPSPLDSSTGYPSMEFDNSDSFLKYLVLWDKTGETEALSPWDMEILPEGGHVESEDIKKRQGLLNYMPKTDEWSSFGQEHDCQRISRGLESICSLAISEPFLAPVDSEIYPDYIQIVPYPINLYLISARCANRFYRRASALIYDVRLILTNANLYNEPSSSIVERAQILVQLCCDLVTNERSRPLALYKTLTSSKTSTRLMDDRANLREAKRIDGETSDFKNSYNASRSRVPTKLANNLSWRQKCDILMKELLDNEDSEPFRKPVDCSEYSDYYTIVRYPIDLGSIYSKLNRGMYNSPKDFRRDIRMVFVNSRAYNTNKRSRIYSMTLRLSALFEERMRKLIMDDGSLKKKEGYSFRERSCINNYNYQYLNNENPSTSSFTRHELLRESDIQIPFIPEELPTRTIDLSLQTQSNINDASNDTGGIRAFDESYHRGKFKGLRSIAAESRQHQVANDFAINNDDNPIPPFISTDRVNLNTTIAGQEADNDESDVECQRDTVITSISKIKSDLLVSSLSITPESRIELSSLTPEENQPKTVIKSDESSNVSDASYKLVDIINSDVAKPSKKCAPIYTSSNTNSNSSDTDDRENSKDHYSKPPINIISNGPKYRLRNSTTVSHHTLDPLLLGSKKKLPFNKSCINYSPKSEPTSTNDEQQQITWENDGENGESDSESSDKETYNRYIIKTSQNIPASSYNTRSTRSTGINSAGKKADSDYKRAINLSKSLVNDSNTDLGKSSNGIAGSGLCRRSLRKAPKIKYDSDFEYECC
ncbi:PH-interacting protein-like isoform X2 [Gordionus sp. m RMFG-2023]|uniref:PH-interacting protein-like isoform X2 n=1 Tax=Gordionus sp. m RMFG-2023 TaxID=3053472 RepID=UPI0031FCFF5B